MYNVDGKSNVMGYATKLNAFKIGFLWIFMGLIILMLPLVCYIGFILISVGVLYLIFEYKKIGDTTLSHSRHYKMIAYLLSVNFLIIIFNIVLLLYMNIFSFRATTYAAIKIFIDNPSNMVNSIHISLGYAIYLFYMSLYIFNVLTIPLQVINVLFFSTFILSIITYFAISYSIKILSDDLDVPALNMSYHFLTLSGFFIIGAFIVFNLDIYYKQISIQYNVYVPKLPLL